jgi:hypothetical protein
MLPVASGSVNLMSTSRRGAQFVYCCWHKPDVLLRRTGSVALGGKADIGRIPPACRSEAIDPSLHLAANFCCDAQRRPLVGFVLDRQFCLAAGQRLTAASTPLFDWV